MRGSESFRCPKRRGDNTFSVVPAEAATQRRYPSTGKSTTLDSRVREGDGGDARTLERDIGIERIAPGDRRLPEHVAGHRLARIGACKDSAEVESYDIEREQREHVPVGNRVVPRWTGAVVSEIVAGHVLVAGEPSGVIVDSLPRTSRRVRA